MSALREILAEFSFKIDDTKLKEANKKTDSFISKLKTFSAVLVGAGMVNAIKNFVVDIQQQGDALNDAADRLGINATELQRWQFAAKLAGVGAEELNTGLKFLQKNAVEAASGGEAATKAFKKLGTDVKTSTGEIKPSNQLLRETLLGISNLKSPAERTASAMEILGRSGSALVPLIKDGPEGLDKLLTKMDELGGGLSENAIKVLGDAGDQFDYLDFSILSLKSHLAVVLFPVLNQLISWLTKSVSFISQAIGNTNLLKAALIILSVASARAGVAIMRTGIAMIVPYLPLIAILTAAALAIDDLITFVKGGDSVIGTFLDKLLGKGTGKSIAKDIKKDFDELWKEIEKAPTIGAKAEAIFSKVGAAIVKFFVDDIPEAWTLFWSNVNKDANTGGKTFIDYISSMLGRVGTIIKTWVKDSAHDIVDGIILGLEENWQKLKNKFSDLLGSLPDVFKEKLKSNSPSKVFYEITGSIPDGITTRLQDAIPDLRKKAGDFFKTIVPPSPTAFTPAIRLPTATLTAPANSGNRTVSMQNQVQITLTGNTPAAYRDAVRQGLNQGFDDERRALLATLDPIG